MPTIAMNLTKHHACSGLLERYRRRASEPSQSFARRYSSTSRRGIAMFEFVMCLPVLLLMFVFILWLGHALTTATAVTIENRQTAWKARHNPPGGPFEYKADSGAIRKELERSLDFSPVFDPFSEPHSEHLVFGGSWDAAQLDLNDQPNWTMYGRVTRSMAEVMRDLLKSGTFNVDDGKFDFGKNITNPFDTDNLKLDFREIARTIGIEAGAGSSNVQMWEAFKQIKEQFGF